MNPVDNCNLIRPLLSINRFETGKLCSFWQLPIYPDISNQKIKFLRNRVRKQLLPLVKIFFNLKVENVLLQLAEIVEAEDHQMNQVAKDFFIAFHNIGCYNFTNVSTTHYNCYIWVPSINFLKQTSFTTYLPSLGCSLIRIDPLLVPQTLVASQALLHLNSLLRTDGNDDRQSNAGLVHTVPHFLKHLTTEGDTIFLLRTGKKHMCCYIPHMHTLPPKVVCSNTPLPKAPHFLKHLTTFGGMCCEAHVVCALGSGVLLHVLRNTEGALGSGVCISTASIRYEHVALPSLMVRRKTASKPHYLPQIPKSGTEAIPIPLKVLIRWILTIFALRTTKGGKRKNMKCKAIPVSLSNHFAQPLYSTSKEGMPFSKVCMSELCMNYVFGNRGSENMWYRYTKGGNYNKLQGLLLTKLMKQNPEFRKLALFSKIGSARNVLPKKGFSNNKKKNSNKFIKKKYFEDVLIYNFFLYFEMLKPEKKEIYWPIIISFLPTAFQRRVTKLFLINQDWKKIRYSQVFNFLAKKKKLC